mmetsp:Transcript_22523/g.25356  ORF Transcript_22523/g.25356 Transcript_22523/m.25356 type:complete len:91 (-) Transcript_22523:120-392(-)
MEQHILHQIRHEAKDAIAPNIRIGTRKLPNTTILILPIRDVGWRTNGLNGGNSGGSTLFFFPSPDDDDDDDGVAMFVESISEYLKCLTSD